MVIASVLRVANGGAYREQASRSPTKFDRTSLKWGHLPVTDHQV